MSNDNKKLAKEIYMKGGASDYELMEKFPEITHQDLFDWDAEKGLLIDKLPFYIPKNVKTEIHPKFIVLRSYETINLSLKKTSRNDRDISGIYLCGIEGSVIQGKASNGSRLKFSTNRFNGNYYETNYQFIIPKDTDFIIEANGPGEKRLYLERK